MEKELDLVDSELELYAKYLYEQITLYERIYDQRKQILCETYGVSSPPIKSTEEAKYKDPPKVYKNDMMLDRIARNEKDKQHLSSLEMEFAMKRIFCLRMQERIITADLTSEEKKIVWFRYFKKYSHRNISTVMNSNRETIRYKIQNLLRKMINFENIATGN